LDANGTFLVCVTQNGLLREPGAAATVIPHLYFSRTHLPIQETPTSTVQPTAPSEALSEVSCQVQSGASQADGGKKDWMDEWRDGWMKGGRER
jgi:hypothetical protein